MYQFKKLQNNSPIKQYSFAMLFVFIYEERHSTTPHTTPNTFGIFFSTEKKNKFVRTRKMAVESELPASPIGFKIELFKIFYNFF